MKRFWLILLLLSGTVQAADQETIVLKAMVSVLTVLTIAACMPFDHICHALRRLHAPEAFTTQLLLLHRYTFVLADEAQSMRQARERRVSRVEHTDEATAQIG